MLVNNELINQCRKGKVNAQKKMYDQCKNHWFTICLRYLNKREDALDVLQNALVKIYTKLDQFDESKGTFTAWSSKIIVNESIMFQRKYWNKNEVAGVNLEIIDVASEPDVYAQLQMEELTKLIQKLPTGYRIIFNMYVIEGYTHSEIAQKLDISIGTSKSQLFKAKNILKKSLKKSSYEHSRMIS